MSFNVSLWFSALTFLSVILKLNSQKEIFIKWNMCYVTWSESFPPSLWNTLVLVNHSLYSSSCSSVSGNLNDLMFVFFLCLSYCAFLHTGIQPYFPFQQLQIVLVVLSLYFQSISRLPSWIWVFAIIQWFSFIYKISCLVLLPWTLFLYPEKCYCMLCKTDSNTKSCISIILIIWHECRVLGALPLYGNQPTNFHCKSVDWFP